MRISLKRMTIGLATVLWLTSCSLGGGNKAKTVILVSAAASLKDSLETIAVKYEAGHPDIAIQFNYGSSGTLQKQIEQGAPADLFLSAGKKQMEALKAQKLVSENRDVLANRLVIILKSDFSGPMTDEKALLEPGIHRIAIGEPETVPAGSYAKQALTSLGMWDELEPRLVYAQDVRQVLTFVETGNADAGLVYQTDLTASGKITKAIGIHADVHDPIIYPFGVIAGSKHPEEARIFYRYLCSQQAMDVFLQKGFLQP